MTSRLKLGSSQLLSMLLYYMMRRTYLAHRTILWSARSLIILPKN